jgi:hypothetical protein
MRPNIVGFLTKAMLDEAAPAHPVIVAGHTGAPFHLNSEALKRLNIPEDMSGIRKDPKTGELTGEFTGEAAAHINSEIALWVSSMEDKIDRLKKGIATHNMRGTTMIHTKIDADALSALRELWARDELTLRWRVAFTNFGGPQEESAFFKRVGNLTGLGDDMLKLYGINPDGADGPGGSTPDGGWSWKKKLHELRTTLPGDDPRVLQEFQGGPGAIIQIAADLRSAGSVSGGEEARGGEQPRSDVESRSPAAGARPGPARHEGGRRQGAERRRVAPLHSRQIARLRTRRRRGRGHEQGQELRQARVQAGR